MDRVGKLRGLPPRLDAARMVEEASRFHGSDWLSHPMESAGNESVVLVSAGGVPNVDFAISGPMKPTAFLESCPYLKQVLNSFEGPLSRCRLVRLPSGAKTSARAMINYHWFRRRPVYIPIITDPAVTLFCHGENIHMAAGDVWAVEVGQSHWMVNSGGLGHCIHLVVETKGSPYRKNMIDSFEQPKSGNSDLSDPPLEKTFFPLAHRNDSLPLEPYTFEVLTPEEIISLTDEILSVLKDPAMPSHEYVKVCQHIKLFRKQWHDVFSRFGHCHHGELAYHDLILVFEEHIMPLARRWLQKENNASNSIAVIRSMLSRSPLPARLSGLRKPVAIPLGNEGIIEEDIARARLERPIIIVSAPRAGSTLLFEALSQFPEVWTIGEESHELIEGIPELHPSARNYHSNRLTEADVLPHVPGELKKRIFQRLRDREGQPYLGIPKDERQASPRFLEKTPKNSLRIPFLKTIFPDAIFIFLYRDPRENIGSLLEGWRSRRFVSYRGLPDWPSRDWSFLLSPGWPSFQNRPLAEIAAFQWKTSNQFIIEDLQTLPPAAWCLVHYADLIRETGSIIKAIARFAGLGRDRRVARVLSRPLPVSRLTLSAPLPEKWRKNEWEIRPAMLRLKTEEIERKLEKLVNSHPKNIVCP